MKKSRGFTLIELLVVIAIIALLSTIAIASFSSARAKARDGQRVADIEQIALALEVYREAYGVYPDTSYEGAIGEGGSFDSALGSILARVPHDPLGPDDSTYQYYYDSRHNCPDHPGHPVAIIFAKTMESEDKANYNEIKDSCGGSIGSQGRGGGEASYNVILGGSTN